MSGWVAIVDAETVQAVASCEGVWASGTLLSVTALEPEVAAS